jgi:hypothetical protein
MTPEELKAKEMPELGNIMIVTVYRPDFIHLGWDSPFRKYKVVWDGTKYVRIKPKKGK